uniref:(northern house mosquito) hypothetical protein n=1 Tax=Culex pipiens TaxID=7175 RepID=A0A8D8BC21_CULPI
MAHSGAGPGLLCPVHRSFPQATSEGRRPEANRHRKAEAWYETQRGEEGGRTAGLVQGHAQDVQATAQEQDPHAEQHRVSVLLLRLHAVLDLHAQVHRNAVQTVGVHVQSGDGHGCVGLFRRRSAHFGRCDIAVQAEGPLHGRVERHGGVAVRQRDDRVRLFGMFCE